LTACQRQELCSEEAVHAFSSLAKPFNHLAKCFARTGGTKSVRHILGAALCFSVEVNQMVVGAFQAFLDRLMLPLSRIVNIGNALYALFLSAFVSLQDADRKKARRGYWMLQYRGRFCRLKKIPNYRAPFDLYIYDSRETKRGPGGEDHVGCRALMRCAFEKDALARKLVMPSACYVTTRRIIVGTLCHL
jgi:hypothetical protein